MNETKDQSPYGRGFIAAAIIIGAILLCGALLLITGLTSPDGTTQAVNVSEPVQATSTAPTPATGVQPAPATPAAERGSGPVSGSRGCALPDGDQSIPIKPPSADGWDVSRRVVVPRSATHGPATTDRDGFRHCFGRSPTGAVFAAYNVVAALADQSQAVPTVQKLMLPGPDTDALIRELRDEEPSGSAPTQLAGYRVLDADTDRATIMLALPVESAYMSITLTLVWHHDDWRLQPPPPGEPVGAPFAQHRNLNDFVAWSGV